MDRDVFATATSSLPCLLESTHSRSHADAETNRSDASNFADSFTATALDPVAYAPYHYLAKLL